MKDEVRIKSFVGSDTETSIEQAEVWINSLLGAGWVLFDIHVNEQGVVIVVMVSSHDAYAGKP